MIVSSHIITIIYFHNSCLDRSAKTGLFILSPIWLLQIHAQKQVVNIVKDYSLNHIPESWLKKYAKNFLAYYCTKNDLI